LPGIRSQAELVPPTAAYTVEHLFERREDGRNYLRYMAFWQVALARVFGPRGLLLAIAGSLGLIAFAAWAATQCRRAYLTLSSSSLDDTGSDVIGDSSRESSVRNHAIVRTGAM
jgi:hypothetical protein